VPKLQRVEVQALLARIFFGCGFEDGEEPVDLFLAEVGRETHIALLAEPAA
jgi:hypothetical protein